MERPAAADGSGVSPMGIMEIVAIALAVAGGISTLAGAGNWIIKIIGAIKAPNAEQDRRLSDLLAQKKISATEAEMKVLIEAAVAEFNEVFKKPLISEPTAGAIRRNETVET